MTRRAWVGEGAGGGGDSPILTFPRGGKGPGAVSAYAGDGSSEYAEFWREMEMAQARYRVNQTMDFFVEASRGHDDYLMSLALMVCAGASPARTARGRVDDASSLGW